MASYTELHGLFSNPDLMHKVMVACIVAADTIRSEDVGTANHTNRMLWAKEAFASPSAAATRMLMAVLAANKSETLVNIQGASDASIQIAVDAAVDVLAGV